MKIDTEYARETLVRLVQINSINPTLAPGAPGEREIAGFIADSLRILRPRDGDSTSPRPDAPACWADWRGTGGGRSLMLNAHCDTVDVAGMAEPFSAAPSATANVRPRRFDMKGSLAACMAAAKALADGRARLRGDVLVAAVADEEYGSLGTTRPDPASQGGRRDRHRAHRAGGLPGAQRLPVDRGGDRRPRGPRQQVRAGHRRQHEDGRSSLHRLSELERDLRARPPHPLVGPPSLHAAMLSGGTGLSTYAASSTVQIERRTVPGETEAQAVAEIQAIVDRLAARGCGFSRHRAAILRARSVRSAARAPAIVKAVDARRGEESSAARRRTSAIRPGWTRRCCRPPAWRRWFAAQQARARTPMWNGWTWNRS